MASYVIANGGSAARVHVVPNGVDTERFHPAVDGTDVRAKLDAGSGLVIGFVGSLKTWHGVDILLEAFRRVASHDWHLMIVGEGPERAALEAQAQGHSGPGRVHFTGAVPHDQIPRYVAAMDIAVAPYRAVPDFYFSPLKLYEYLAAGKPVVASNIGQIASVVRHGYNGYLVEPGEAPALSHALEELAGDVRLRAQLSRNAPQGLVTWEATARRVLALAAGAAAEGVRP
jgi:glycosyltransferase involved in cell wall biosynthesis